MKHQVNRRILALKDALKMGHNEFCYKSGISTSTFKSIQDDQEIRPSTVKKIASALGANADWLLNGSGEMLATETPVPLNPWKDVAFTSIREENNRLAKEVERLWQMIGHMSGGKVNFLKVLEKAGVAKNAQVVNLYEKVAHSGARLANS